MSSILISTMQCKHLQPVCRC